MPLDLVLNLLLRDFVKLEFHLVTRSLERLSNCRPFWPLQMCI